MTARFTSTAGVGKDSWTEPIDSGVINHITGTLSGTYNANGSIVIWTGNAAIDRVSPAIYGGASGSYDLVSGWYHVVASGLDSLGSGCQQTGSKTFSLAPATPVGAHST